MNRAIVNSKVASSEGSRVSAVQNRAIVKLKERRPEVLSRGFLRPCDSAERTGLRTYALMVRKTKELITLDPNSK